MFCDCAAQCFGDCWHFCIGGKELQHALVLLGRWHDLRRRVRDTHAHGRPINIRSGQRIPNQIARTLLRLLLQTLIEQTVALNQGKRPLFHRTPKPLRELINHMWRFESQEDAVDSTMLDVGVFWGGLFLPAVRARPPRPASRAAPPPPPPPHRARLSPAPPPPQGIWFLFGLGSLFRLSFDWLLLIFALR